MNKILVIVFLVLLSPVFFCIGILVKLSIKGTVIYKQARVGSNFEIFHIYKFRTMHHSPDQSSIDLTQPDDARVPLTGRFLRKYRLDELPQLINRIKSEMNWIGPRPEQEYYVQKLLSRSHSFDSLYQVKPGLTSLGMVKFGYAKNLDEIERRAKYDKYYLQHRTLKLDVYIIIQTVKIILQGKGH